MGPYYDFNQQYMSQLPSGNPAAGNPAAGSDSGSGLGNFLSGLGSVASGIPIIGSLIGGGLNLLGQHFQNKHQMEMWEKNNEYNSPQAMMERMKAAGINPNAAAQGISGAPSAGAATMPQAAQAPDLSSIGNAIGNSVNNALSAQAQKAQIDNVKANTDYLRSQTAGQDIENQYTPARMQSVIDKTVADANYTVEQTKIAKSFADHAEEFRGLEITKLNKEIENYQHQWDKIESDIKRNEFEIGLNGVQAQLAKAQTDFWNEKLQGFEPGSPQYVLASAARDFGTESREYKDALKVIGDIEHELESAGQRAENENNPVIRTQKQLTEEYEDNAAYLDKRIKELEHEKREYETGKKKDNWFNTNMSQIDYELKSLKGRKANLYREYTENMRRLKNNETVGVSTSGVSQSK